MHEGGADQANRPAASQAEKDPAAEESFADIVARLLEAEADASAPGTAATALQAAPTAGEQAAPLAADATAVNLQAVAAWAAPHVAPAAQAAPLKTDGTANLVANLPTVDALPQSVGATPAIRITAPQQPAGPKQATQILPANQSVSEGQAAPALRASVESIPQEGALVAASAPEASAAKPLAAGGSIPQTLQGGGPSAPSSPTEAISEPAGQKVVRTKAAGAEAEAAARGSARSGASAFQQALAAAGSGVRVTSSSSGDGSADASLLSMAGQAASNAAQASTPTVSTSTQASAAQLERQPVVDQIASRLSSVGVGEGRQVTIDLHPPELGRVQATFQTDGDGVRCLVVVSNPQTLDLVHRETASLMARLAEGGVQLKQIEVSLGHSSSSGSFGSGSGPMQDGSFARGGGQGSFGQSASGGQERQGGGEASLPRPMAEGGSSSRPAAGAGLLNVWM